MQVSVKLNIRDTSTRTISILFTAATWNSVKKAVQVSSLNKSVDHSLDVPSADSGSAEPHSSAFDLRLLPTPFLLLILRERQFKRSLCAPPGAPDTIQVVFNKTPALLCTMSRFTTHTFSLNLRVAQIERPCLQGTSLIRGAQTPGRSQSTQTDGGTDEDREEDKTGWHFSLTAAQFPLIKRKSPTLSLWWWKAKRFNVFLINTCTMRPSCECWSSAGEHCWTNTFSLPSRHIQKP